MKHKEFGGYLPIELRESGGYFDNQPKKEFNCGKAALNYVLNNNSFNKIFVPYYLCPNVCRELESHNIEVVYYHINRNLLPDIMVDEPNICIYFVDYFGVIDTSIAEVTNKIKKATVILDFCHSFYCEPVIKENVYNIYSAKKFFGVPDGAYLIANNLISEDDNYSFSSDYSDYLLKSLEHGTNYCYKQKKEADIIISDNYGNMSVLAKRILGSIDYQNVKRIRKNNCAIYDSFFKDINRIKVEKGSTPYMYPLNVEKNIKKELINEKIYVPTLWAQLLDKKFDGTFEQRLTNETLFLPVDQRYNDEDINYIVSIVKKYL